jgi:hypothetical protein
MGFAGIVKEIFMSGCLGQARRVGDSAIYQKLKTLSRSRSLFSFEIADGGRIADFR